MQTRDIRQMKTIRSNIAATHRGQMPHHVYIIFERTSFSNNSSLPDCPDVSPGQITSAMEPFNHTFTVRLLTLIRLYRYVGTLSKRTPS